MGLVACSSANNGDDDDDGANVCGDGVEAGGEGCDDGNTVDGDGCSAMCEPEGPPPSCGNGAVNVGTEQCDDGNTVDGDGCSSTCQNECGNGALDGAEACDDGNTANDDGCTAMCAVEPDYTCTGEPSVCTKMDVPPAGGSCANPFQLTLTPNGEVLEGTGTGDTTGGTDQVVEAACETWNAGAAADHIWQFTLTERRDVLIVISETTPFDSVLRLFSEPCNQVSELPDYTGEDGCSDSGLELESEALAYIGLPAGTYYVVIDGYDDAQIGSYSFTVSAYPSACGDGAINDPVEWCDDGNTMDSDGCDSHCAVELGYACDGEPSVCTAACGNNAIDPGEECDDGGTVDGDRCSSTCALEFDVSETEPNDTAAQSVAATSQRIRGSFINGDIDLYTFTLTQPATVELEIYNGVDSSEYTGLGSITSIDCLDDLDTEIRVFDATGDVTTNATALIHDDDDGDGACSYAGPTDGIDSGGANPMEGVLEPGTYTIKVNMYGSVGTAPVYILDLKVVTSGPAQPVAPVAGDLVLNEFMAADNLSDTNCDGATTNTHDEFVELVNVSTNVLDLNGVTVGDSVATRHTFAAGTILEPGKAIVVWGGGAPACADVTNWAIASGGQLGLNDGGDTITVADAAAVQLIQVVFPAATANVSANLSPDVTGTTYDLHNNVSSTAFSPGKRADGSAF
ncbi:MAG: DUF4215 domain-containing protein [Kofleriaceae bacterium]